MDRLLRRKGRELSEDVPMYFVIDDPELVVEDDLALLYT